MPRSLLRVEDCLTDDFAFLVENVIEHVRGKGVLSLFPQRIVVGVQNRFGNFAVVAVEVVPQSLRREPQRQVLIADGVFLGHFHASLMYSTDSMRKDISLTA